MPTPGSGVCSVAEDVQVEQINAVNTIANILVLDKALKAGDRVVLLLKGRVVVLQNTEINPLLFRQSEANLATSVASPPIYPMNANIC